MQIIFIEIGALNTQSDTDDTRPSTYPTENTQLPQKRFINIDKYIDESSMDSSTPERTNGFYK